MLAVADDGSVSDGSEVVVYRPPPPPFPLLSPSLLSVNYSPLNVRVLHVQPTSALLAWDAPINHSSVEVCIWNELLHVTYHTYYTGLSCVLVFCRCY